MTLPQSIITFLRLVKSTGSCLASSPFSSPMDSDDLVLKIEPLHDAFLARELEDCRFNKTQEDVWISNIARDVERDEHAVRPRYTMIPMIPVI